MSHVRFSIAPFLVFTLLVAGLFAPEELAGQPTLVLGSDTASAGENAELPLTLTSADPVQGLVAAFEWNGANGVGVDLTTEAALAGADTVQKRVEADYMVLGVVVDADGEDDEIIPAGNGIVLATAVIECLGAGTATPVAFADGKYATVDGGPLLDNLVVVEGRAIDADGDLVLTDGSFACEEVGARILALGSDMASVGQTAEIPLTLTAPDDVQGFVAAFEWNSANGMGVDLATGAVLANADTVQRRVEPDYMVLGVVMDSDGLDGEIIPPGNDIVLATAAIECLGVNADTPITFADGKYASVDGGPLLDNLLVVGGLAIGAVEGLVLASGSFGCEGVEAKTLALGSDTASVGQNVELPLTLSSSEPVQGLEAAFEWDGGNGSGVELVQGPALADADTVQTRVEADYMVLGVVVDNDGAGPDAIPPGNDILLATAVIQCLGESAANPVTFAAGKYAAAEGGALVDNILVVDGLAVGPDEGLVLTDGSFGCEGVEDQILTLGSDTANVGQNAEIPLTLTSTQPIQGLVAAFEWNGASGSGAGLVAGPALDGADAVQIRVEADYMVLGVVMDTDGAGPDAIPPGNDQLVATAEIECLGVSAAIPIAFADGKYAAVVGGPLVDNIVVIDGTAIGDGEGLILTDGSFGCEGVEPKTLALGSDTARVGQNVELPLTLSSTEPVQGLEAAFEWDGASGGGVDLVPGPALAGADTVQTRAEADYMVLGVVMDNDGAGPDAIPPGSDILLATATIQCLGATGNTPVTFEDGRYAVADGGPLVDNIVVVDGMAIGVAEGLILTDGSFGCEGVEDQLLTLGSDTARVGQDAEIPLTLTSTEPIEGLVAAFEWNGANGRGAGLVPGPALADADTVESRIEADYMVLSVVVDTNGAGPDAIPPGNNQLVATVEIECLGVGAATPVAFADGKYAAVPGGPLVDNIVVIDGLAVGADTSLVLTDGSFTCEQVGVKIMALGSDTARVGQDVELPLTISSADPVQGLEAAFDWDGARGTGADLVPGPALADADTVQARVEPDYMVLGVVVDMDATGPDAIPPGDDTLIATAVIQCSGVTASSPVTFVDDTYAVIEGGPLLDNILVVNGRAIGTGEGLVLTNGSFGCEQVEEKTMALGSDTARVGQNAELPLTLTSTEPVQGVVAAFDWDGARGRGDDLVTAAAIAGADTVQRRVEADYMVLGVVMDVDGAGPDAIPPGNDILLATAAIECLGAGGPTPVTFADGEYAAVPGGPEVDNIVVVDGIAIGAGEGLILTDGSFGCQQVEAKIMALGSDTARVGQDAELPLTLTSTDPVQGLVAAFEWNGSRGRGVDLVTAPAIDDADTVQKRVEPDYMVLGVAMDIDGAGPDAIPPGDDILIATAVIECTGSTTSTPVTFEDGKYAAAPAGPLLDNIVVVDGRSIGVDDGLILTDGSFGCEAVGAQILALGSDTAIVGENAEIPLTLSSTEPVQGLVAAFEWNGARGRGADLVAEPAIAGADTVQRRIEPDYMVLSVVMDTDGAGPDAIPPGDNILLATAAIECLGSTTSTPVEFADGEYAAVPGGPLLDNIVVIDGVAIGVDDGLILTDGSFRCIQPGDRIVVAVDIKPGSCPNPYNVRAQGVLPVAILGAEDFDVTQIDPESIRLEGVPILRYSFGDVAARFHPLEGKQDCRDCTFEGPDGFLDMKVKFSRPELTAVLGEVADRECRVLQLTGTLKEEFGATLIEGEDVIGVLIPRNERVRRRDSQEEDVNGDGVFNIKDPIDLAEHLTLGEKKLKALGRADANKDGKVNTADALHLLNKFR